MADSFKTRRPLEVGGRSYQIHALDGLARHHVEALPYSLKILLENLLRHQEGEPAAREQVEALLGWNGVPPADAEIGFVPARVVLQDFTGVPSIVDLAAMREAMQRLGGDPDRMAIPSQSNMI